MDHIHVASRRWHGKLPVPSMWNRVPALARVSFPWVRRAWGGERNLVPAPHLGFPRFCPVPPRVSVESFSAGRRVGSTEGSVPTPFVLLCYPDCCATHSLTLVK